MVLYRGFEIFDGNVNRLTIDQILKNHSELFKIIADRFLANNIDYSIEVALYDTSANIAIKSHGQCFYCNYYYEFDSIMTLKSGTLQIESFVQYDEIMRNTIGFNEQQCYFINEEKNIRLHKIFPAKNIGGYSYHGISTEDLIKLLAKNDLYHPQQGDYVSHLGPLAHAPHNPL